MLCSDSSNLITPKIQFRENLCKNQMNMKEIKLKNRLITLLYRRESAMRFAPATLI
jgi:hypothetical protein